MHIVEQEMFDPRFREMSNIAAISGEVTLFRAVIARAMNDAVAGLSHLGDPEAIARRNSPESRETRMHREEARDWLLSDSVDFRRICNWALLDPDAVRDAARRNIDSASREFEEVQAGPVAA
ncbi:MAG: hypothetical protein GEU92_11930 [Alphaproteobacteria bacterium]|nr:hypothetical protein [Alphaproteobacteria bacterium]